MCAIVSSTENLKILIGGCGAIMSLIIGLFQVELIFSLLNDFIDSYLKWQKIDNEIDVLIKIGKWTIFRIRRCNFSAVLNR